MPINRMNKRTGKSEWYGKVTHNGQSYTKKLPSKRDALKWEQLTRRELESQRSTGTVYLSTLFNQYLDNVQARFGASSYKDKARVFREAMQRFGDVPVKALAYIQAMLRHKNATTTSRYLHSLQGIRAPKIGAFEQKGARSGAQTLEDEAQMTATR